MAGHRDPTGVRGERALELRDRMAAVRAEMQALETERRSLQQEWRSVREIVSPGGWALVAVWVTVFMGLTFLWAVLDARGRPAWSPPPWLPPTIERPLGEVRQACPRSQFSAGGWHVEQLSRASDELRAAAIACGAAGDLWIAAAGTLTRRFPDGHHEREWPEDIPWRAGTWWRSMHLAAGGAGLALTNDNVLMVRDDGHWDLVRLGGQRMEAVWSDGRSRVWLAGGGRVASLPAALLTEAAGDGKELSLAEATSWRCLWPTKKPCSGLVRAIWGAGPEDVWVAGNDGILHMSHDRWARAEPGGAFALWGSGPRDVWAVGRRGSIRHWNGTSWLETPTPVVADLYGISGSRPDDVWAVGDDWTVLRWDGTLWSSVSAPADMLAERAPGPLPDHRTLHAVCAAGRHVFIAGEPNVLLRFDAGP